MPYTREQVRKVAGPQALIVTPAQAAALLDAPTSTRPRVYGLFQSAILAYPSTDALDARPTPHLWVADPDRSLFTSIRKA